MAIAVAGALAAPAAALRRGGVHGEGRGIGVADCRTHPGPAAAGIEITVASE